MDKDKKQPQKLSEEATEMREGLMDRFHKDDVPPAEKKEEPAKPDLKAEPSVKSEAPAVIGQPPALEPAKSEAAPVAPAKKDGAKDTHVPIEALHEARADVKNLKQQLAEVMEQNKILLKDAKEWFQQKKEEGADGVLPPADYDKKLHDMDAEIKRLNGIIQADQQKSQASEAAKARENTRLQIETTDSQLEKDGFKGFKKFVSMVEAEIFRVAREQGKEEAIKLDNPDGWKKIYKERIFPEIKGFSDAKSHEAKIEAKEALKTGADLLPPTDQQPPVAPAEDSELTWDQYLAERNGHSPQPQRNGVL